MGFSLNGATYKTYDRALRTREDVLNAFRANRDFWVSTYRASSWTRINRSQIEEQKVLRIHVRYAMDRKVVYLKRTRDTEWQIE